MNSIFMDTVGLLALWDPSDQWHGDASIAYERLLQDRLQVVTTEQVMFECGNAAARKPYRQLVEEYRRRLASRDQLIEPTRLELNHAWAAYARGEPGGPGVVDHISFQVMRRLGIGQAFTNDRHFRAAGFEILF